MALALAPTDVCNMALGSIGETTLLTNYATDRGPAAAVCRTWWDSLVDIACSAYPWLFATDQAGLVQRVGVSRSGWDYVYDLPLICLRPLAVLVGGDRLAALSVASRTPFEIFPRGIGQVNVLACNVPPTDSPILEYVARVTNVPAWPMDFVEGVAFLLAAKLALALPKDAALAAAMAKAGYAGLAQTYRRELAGQEPGPEPLTPSLAARG
jgi:hypothetical protein